MIEYSSFLPEIIPAIIPKAWRDITEKVERVHKHVKRVQVDIVDGEYAPGASWPFNGADVPAYRDLVEERTGLPHWDSLSFELDMMVRRPEDVIDEWITAGFETLIIHVESTEKLDEVLARAEERGTGVALALKPSTENDVLEPFTERIAFVQCMGSDRIGHHGEPLDERVYDKIRNIKARWDIPVGVDIGINRKTSPRLIEAGVTRLVSGSAVFGEGDIAENIAALRGA